MDTVRFGRALGMGARSAAKALVTAADAAVAPNPSVTRPPANSPAVTPTDAPRTAAAAPVPGAAASSPAVEPAGPQLTEMPRARPVARISETAARAGSQVRQTTAGVARGGKRFGEAVWGPFVKLSGVLWLELTGVFFGLFLLTASMNAWKLRGNFFETAVNHADHRNLQWSLVMMAVFGYFCVSSFVRARRRERRGQ